MTTTTALRYRRRRRRRRRHHARKRASVRQARHVVLRPCEHLEISAKSISGEETKSRDGRRRLRGLLRPSKDGLLPVKDVLFSPPPNPHNPPRLAPAYPGEHRREAPVRAVVPAVGGGGGPFLKRAFLLVYPYKRPAGSSFAPSSARRFGKRDLLSSVSNQCKCGSLALCIQRLLVFSQPHLFFAHAISV